MDRRTVVRAALLDFGAIVLFVAVGRRTHDEGSAVVGLIKVAAPFALAAVAGWCILRAWSHAERPIATGAPLWLITVAGGMVLRRVVFDRGTAASFVIVATLALGTLMVGWRLIATVMRRRGALR